MIRFLSFLSLLLLTGCFQNLRPQLGQACDDVTRPCNSGYACVFIEDLGEGRCIPEDQDADTINEAFSDGTVDGNAEDAEDAGSSDGSSDGPSDSNAEDAGSSDGSSDSNAEDAGSAEGAADDATDGNAEDAGNTDGTADGAADGNTDGNSDGTADGATAGNAEDAGNTDGMADGAAEGNTDGNTDGTADGAAEGNTDGSGDGSSDGSSDGATDCPNDCGDYGTCTSGSCVCQPNYRADPAHGCVADCGDGFEDVPSDPDACRVVANPEHTDCTNISPFVTECTCAANTFGTVSWNATTSEWDSTCAPNPQERNLAVYFNQNGTSGQAASSLTVTGPEPEAELTLSMHVSCNRAPPGAPSSGCTARIRVGRIPFWAVSN